MLPKDALNNVRGDVGSQQWTNLVNGQVHPPQGDDQPGQTDLIPSVAPIARVMIDHGRGEQPNVVAVPQTVHRQPAQPSELTDRDQTVVRHAFTVMSRVTPVSTFAEPAKRWRCGSWLVINIRGHGWSRLVRRLG